MIPCLVLIDIWPLPSDQMAHLPDHLAIRHNIARLIHLCVDRNIPVFSTSSGRCLPDQPPEFVEALRLSGILYDDSALAPDGWDPSRGPPMVHHLSNGEWPLRNASLPDRHRVLLYAGHAADSCLGDHSPWGFLRMGDRRDVYLVEGITLVTQRPDRISSSWPDWKDNPMTGAPLQTRTLSFLHDHARDRVTDVLRMDEVEALLDHLPEPPATSFTLACVPFPIQEGSADTARLLNSVESWIRLSPQPEILFLCEDDETAEFLGTHYPGVRTTTDLARNRLGDLDLGYIFRTIDALATHDLLCYIDSDVILLPHTTDVLAYAAGRYTPGTYSLCAGRWSIPSGLSLDFDSPTWPDVVRSSIVRSHDAGSDFAIYPRGVLGSMPPFSIGKGWWDGWRMARLLQLGLQLVNVQALQFAFHQDHGHRRSGHPGTGHNVRLCEASGLKYVWIRDVKEKVGRKEFETWLKGS